MKIKLFITLFCSVVQLMAFCGVVSKTKESLGSPGDQSASQVRLSLKTDKAKYKIDDPIPLSIQLENIGSEPIYLHFALALDAPIGGSYTELGVFTSDEKPVRYQRSIADSAPAGESPRGVQAIIKAYYFLINPKYLYGKTESIYPKECGMTKAGKYKLVVTYHNSEPTRWSPEEKASLKYYIVGGELKSNPVWIEIIP